MFSPTALVLEEKLLLVFPCLTTDLEGISKGVMRRSTKRNGRTAKFELASS